jgi:predicted nucleic acid-binding protein
MILLDANYILRYLLEDHPDMYAKAVETIENLECLIPGEVLAEVVYVLTGYYKVPRDETAQTLQSLLSLPNLHLTAPKEQYYKTLELLGKSSLDYVDCLLCVLGRDQRVATFDKKLRQCMESSS